LSGEVVGFEKIKDEYESCPDFKEIVYALKGVIPKIDSFLLHDGYLFRFRKLMCSLYFLERLPCLGIACWRSN